MRRLLSVLAAVALLHACGGEDASPSPAAPGAETPADEKAPAQGALRLQPRLELVGIGDVHEAFSVSRLVFDAELVVLSDEPGEGAAGDSIDVRFVFNQGRASTVFIDDEFLRLARTGRYSLFIRVRPDGDGAASVTVGGALASRFDESPADAPRHKADEPAPLPARPGGEAPTPFPDDEGWGHEPAPLPADEGWAGGSPADEPAPLPADEGWAYEPAPLPADEGYDDEPAPLPARHKADAEAATHVGETGFEPVFVRSRRVFNFYAGTVDVQPGDTRLWVTWDVRTWLRSVMADQLGIQREDVAETPQPGFADAPADFRIDAR